MQAAAARSLVRRVVPEALASRKVVYREVCTEGSETAKPGTDEQESHKRLIKSDEQAHHCDLQTPKGECFISRCGRHRGKEDVLTWGDLSVIREKSAEAIVLGSNRGRAKR